MNDRMLLGLDHELDVMNRIQGAGHSCFRWGQAMFAPEVRAALRRTHSFVKWAPDLMSVVGRDVIWVDPKTGRDDTPNYCLECSSLAAAQRWMRAYEEEFVYVWHDFRVTSAADLNPADAGWARIVPHEPSRTPWWKIPKSAGCHREFSDVFPMLPPPVPQAGGRPL